MIKWTLKQISILNVIKKGNDDGSLCSVYDIMAKLPYECKRDAVLHSIKILHDEGLIDKTGPVKRNNRNVQVFRLTTKALPFL